MQKGILFSEEDKQNLKKIIEFKNHCELQIIETYNKIWFRDPKSVTELQIVFVGNFQLTIINAEFNYKRVGTMT